VRSVSKTKARKSAPQKSRKPEITAEALERLIAERFGVRPVQVSVRGDPPDWTATLIARWQGNVTRQIAFLSLVEEMRADYDLKPG
jgi:hypothetical protein